MIERKLAIALFFVRLAQFIAMLGMIYFSSVWFYDFLKEKAEERRLEQEQQSTLFMAMPPAPDCYHLYNKGVSTQWQECMGVGPR